MTKLHALPRADRRRPRRHPVAILLAALVTAAPPLAAAAEPERVALTREACVALVRESATYVPGLDVLGRPVVPADVGGAAPSIGEITVPIYGLYGWNRGNALAAPLLAVATVRGGQVFVQGEPLDANDASAAVERCRRMLAAGD